ncbi:hypothetical protein C8R42DRAFT_728020 [Lentinula raphanica]|nr:hypothetical protein C8R42DRAFT_728020 [Lentinula raphanica]
MPMPSILPMHLNIVLVKKYKDLAKRLCKTGKEVCNDDEEIMVLDDQDKDEYLDRYVEPQGLDETTTDKICNIWEEIIDEFPPFLCLHALLAARANITPPSAHYWFSAKKPDTDDHPNSPSSPADNFVLDNPEVILPRPSTFGSFALALDTSAPSTPLAPILSGAAPQVASSTSVSNAIAKARSNQSRPQKVYAHVCNSNSVKHFTLQKELNKKLFHSQVVNLHSKNVTNSSDFVAGIVSPASAKVKLQAIDSVANSTLLDSSPPSSPTRQDSS